MLKLFFQIVLQIALFSSFFINSISLAANLFENRYNQAQIEQQLGFQLFGLLSSQPNPIECKKSAPTKVSFEFNKSNYIASEPSVFGKIDSCSLIEFKEMNLSLILVFHKRQTNDGKMIGKYLNIFEIQKPSPTPGKTHEVYSGLFQDISPQRKIDPNDVDSDEYSIFFTKKDQKLYINYVNKKGGTVFDYSSADKAFGIYGHLDEKGHFEEL